MERGGFPSETNSFIEYDTNKDVVIKYTLDRVLPDNANIIFIPITEPSVVGVDYKHKAIELTEPENSSVEIPIEKMLSIIVDFYYSEEYTKFKLDYIK